MLKTKYRGCRFHAPVTIVAMMIAASAGSRAAAQGLNPKPISNSGGYSGQALQNIYRNSIGTGYSSQSINAQTMASVRGNVQPNLGQQQQPSVSLPAATIGAGIGGLATKPFTNITQRPTVSPYLNLFNTSRTGNSDFNYQTLVRPQLQQQAINQQQLRQNLDVDRRVQALAARGAYQNQAGSDQQYPTGHQTTFMYLGHYYSDANPHRKRAQ
jgi:hypothetical protein